MERPLVTIVTPSYNQGRFLEDTILSVLNQNYPNIEYFICDGGSTDESVEIIQKYSDKISWWVSEKDRGQADAINKGWKRSSGKYIGWINSDDLLLPDAISTAVEYLESHPNIGFVFGDIEIIDEFGRVLQKRQFEEFDLIKLVRTAGWISQQGNLFRKTIYETIGELDINLHFQLDLDYWIRVGLVSKVGYIPRVLGRFRRYDQSKTGSSSYIAAEDILRIYGKLFSNPMIPFDLIKFEKEAWSNAYLYSSVAMYGSNRLHEAFSRLQKAVKFNPNLIFTKKFLKFFLSLCMVWCLGGQKSSTTHFIKKFWTGLHHR